MKKLMQKTWPACRQAWPIAAILAAAAIFFYPVWLQNKIPLPADFVVGTYLPWLDYKWGYPAGVPVKNPITTDVVSFIYPMRMYAVDLLKSGKLPLWNPLILTGTPLLANFQSAPFSPTVFLYFLLPKLDAWTWQIISQVILAAVFSYFLLEELGRSKLASLSGLFFAFGGFMIIWLEWNAHSLVAAFFPAILLLTLKWLRAEKALWGCCLSLTLAFQILAGYPQIILYEFLILPVVLFIFDRRIFRQPRKLAFFCLYIGLGLGLAGIQILPGLELIRESQRNLETLKSDLAFIPWQSLVMLIAPDYFGNHATYNYWGPAHYTIASGYSGIIALTLAMLGLLTSLRQKGVSLAIYMIALAVLLGFENPLSFILQKSNFLGLQAASSQRILFFFNMGVSMLASFGVDYLLSKKVSLKKLIQTLTLPSLVLLALFFFSLISLNLHDDQNLRVGFRNLAPPIMFLSLCAVLFFLIAKTKNLAKHLTFALMVVATLELFKFGWKYEPFSSKNLVFPTTPVIDYLQTQPKPFRVIGSKVIPTNLLMPYSVSTVEGYDAVYPLQIAGFLSAINTNSPDNHLGRYGTINNFSSPLINLANAEYIIVSKRENFDTSRFEKVFEDRSVVLLKNKDFLPRALMFYDWQVEGTDKVMGTLLDNPSYFKTKIVIDNDPEINKAKGSGIVNLAEYESNRVVKGNTDSPGLLYIADSWYPGWKAYVNGRQVNILRADFNFMAIPIKEVGDFIVRLDYQPDSIKIGLIITGVSFTLVILLIMIEYLRKSKNEV